MDAFHRTIDRSSAADPFMLANKPQKRPVLFQTGQPVYQKESAPQRKPRAVKEPDIEPPKNFKEAVGMGLKDAGLALKQSAQGVASMVDPIGGEKFEEGRKRTEAERERLNTARDRYQGGEDATGFIKEAAARFPGNFIKTIPEIWNPFTKAKLGNAAYHGTRSYAATKDPVKSAIAAGSNVLGEKAESLVRNIPGNAAGIVMEKSIGEIGENASQALAENAPAVVAHIQNKKKSN